MVFLAEIKVQLWTRIELAPIREKVVNKKEDPGEGVFFVQSSKILQSVFQSYQLHHKICMY